MFTLYIHFYRILSYHKYILNSVNWSHKAWRRNDLFWKSANCSGGSDSGGAQRLNDLLVETLSTCASIKHWYLCFSVWRHLVQVEMSDRDQMSCLIVTFMNCFNQRLQMMLADIRMADKAFLSIQLRTHWGAVKLSKHFLDRVVLLLQNFTKAEEGTICQTHKWDTWTKITLNWNLRMMIIQMKEESTSIQSYCNPNDHLLW